jgi:hypothetical protein
MTDCGPTQYIKRDLYANPPTSSCVDCYPLTMKEEINITNEEDLVEFIRKKGRNTDLGDLSINYRQCQNYEKIYIPGEVPRVITGPEGTAALAKEEANSGRVTVDTGTWEVLQNVDNLPDLMTACDNSITDHGIDTIRVCEIINFYKNTDFSAWPSDYPSGSANPDTNPGSFGYLNEIELEREIRRQFGTANQVDTSGSIDYTLPNLPTEYGGENTIQAYKNAIHSKRGYYIATNTSIINYLRGLNTTLASRGMPVPSPDFIIIEEIYDFWIELNRRDTTKSSDIGGINIQDLFSGQPSSTEFEICMNGLFDRRLHSNKDYDSDIQETISNHTSIVKLTHTEINYIEDKLKVIATMEPDDAMECMNILNLGEMICDKGVSDRMLKMAYLVFHIIGLDKMDLDTIERGSKEYYHLTKILDRLTPYIRRAVKKILEISKHYELKTCGYESTTTHVLETIYMDVFEKTKEVDVHIDSLDFIPTYLIKDTNMMEFTRTIILLIVTIAGVYVLLMVLNRPVIK